MVEDIKLAVGNKLNVKHFGRMGGMVTTPEEVVENIKSEISLKDEDKNKYKSIRNFHFFNHFPKKSPILISNFFK